MTVDESRSATGSQSIHARCGRCPALPRGMYLVPQLRLSRQGHRASFSTDGRFAEYAISNVNDGPHPDTISDAEATLIVTGTAMYGLDVMGGVIAGSRWS